MQDIQAQFAKQIAPLIAQWVTGGLTGTPTASQQAGMGQVQGQLRQKAGQMGIQPGDPRLMDMFRQMTEGLTKPSPDVMQTALSLYTGAPTPGGSSTTTSQPGLMGALGTIGNLGLDYALMSKLLGGAGTTAAATAVPTALTDFAFLA